MEQSIYHERQSKQLCLLHSINNLFQEKAFRKEDFDKICENLSPNAFVNPHKSLMPGYGNYDINVMFVALQKKGYEALWFDKRKQVNLLNLDKIFGFILNVPVQKSALSLLNPLNLFYERKHWIALKKLDSNWFNLDSKLPKPKLVGNNTEFLEFLNRKNDDANCQILIIIHESLNDEAYLKQTN